MEYEIGRINSLYYKLVRDKLGNQQACDSKYAHIRRWFLWVGGNTDDYYVGNYKSKAEALRMVL